MKGEGVPIEIFPFGTYGKVRHFVIRQTGEVYAESLCGNYGMVRFSGIDLPRCERCRDIWLRLYYLQLDKERKRHETR